MTQTCTTKQTWIKWDGGECPVDPDTLVAIRLVSGETGGFSRAGDWEWLYGSIIAYTTDIPVVEFVDHAADNTPEWLGKALNDGSLR